jgi:hypothetical protein
MRNDMTTTGKGVDFVEHLPTTCSWTSRIVWWGRTVDRTGERYNRVAGMTAFLYRVYLYHSQEIILNGGIL